MQLGLSFRLSSRLLSVCLLALAFFGGEARLGAQLPAASQPGAFFVAYDGESYLFNYEAGVVKAPFLHNVYKPFGLSQDSRYFLYLKSNGIFPTFSLYSYDLVTATDKKLSGDSVHNAVWSPAGPEVAAVSLDASNQFHVAIYDSASGSRTEVASGMIQPDFLEWSPNGNELLYVRVIPLTPTYISDQQFRYELHRYSTKAQKEIAVPDAT